MGWWDTNRDGGSFAGFLREDDGTDYVWGDSPADVMDDAVHQIIAIFREAWGRDPKAGEIRAGLNFALLNKDDDEDISRE